MRWQGKSVIDITWATPPAARFVRDWRVVTELKTFSDHLYIELALGTTRHHVLGCAKNRGDGRSRRWALHKLDPDRLMGAVLAAAWPEKGPRERDVHQEVEWFRCIMSDACDISMPRTKSRPRRAAY